MVFGLDRSSVLVVLVDEVVPDRDLRRPLPRPRPYVDEPNPSFIQESSSFLEARCDCEDDDDGLDDDDDEVESDEVPVLYDEKESDGDDAGEPSPPTPASRLTSSHEDLLLCLLVEYGSPPVKSSLYLVCSANRRFCAFLAYP